MQRGTPAVRNGIAAMLAGLAAAGYLVGSGALDPVLRSAVTTALGEDGPGSADAGGSGGSDRSGSRDRAGGGTQGGGEPGEPGEGAEQLAITRVADWMYFDDRPEWSTLRENPRPAQRPKEPATPLRPAVAPPENPHRVQFSGPAPMPRHSLEPMRDCPQPRGQGHNAQRLTAEPGVESATVTWWDLGDPDTVSYQIAIVPVGATGNPVGYTNWSTETEPVRYIEVDAPRTCRQESALITGLKSGDAYRFWLLANNDSPVQNGRRYRPTRGETETVTIR